MKKFRSGALKRFLLFWIIGMAYCLAVEFARHNNYFGVAFVSIYGGVVTYKLIFHNNRPAHTVEAPPAHPTVGTMPAWAESLMAAQEKQIAALTGHLDAAQGELAQQEKNRQVLEGIGQKLLSEREHARRVVNEMQQEFDKAGMSSEKYAALWNEGMPMAWYGVPLLETLELTPHGGMQVKHLNALTKSGDLIRVNRCLKCGTQCSLVEFSDTNEWCGAICRPCQELIRIHKHGCQPDRTHRAVGDNGPAPEFKGTIPPAPPRPVVARAHYPDGIARDVRGNPPPAGLIKPLNPCMCGRPAKYEHAGQLVTRAYCDCGSSIRIADAPNHDVVASWNVKNPIKPKQPSEHIPAPHEERGLPISAGDTHLGTILLKDFLRPLKMSVAELGVKANMRDERIIDIIMGRCTITQEEAHALGKAFGTTPEYWIALQYGKG